MEEEDVGGRHVVCSRSRGGRESVTSKRDLYSACAILPYKPDSLYSLHQMRMNGTPHLGAFKFSVTLHPDILVKILGHKDPVKTDIQ